MPNHHISIAYAAFIAAQSAPEEVNISSFTRGIYALLSPLPTFWRVVGITENALKKLSENLDANRLPTGLRRAHIQQRAETVTTLLTGPEISIEDFEEALLGEADHTILCAVGENNNQIAARTDISWLEKGNISDDPLFQPRGFAARWGEREKALVRRMIRCE